MPGIPITPATCPDTIAAVDLGSNSFHMIVARVDSGQIQVIDRLREMVRLGSGLDEHKHLTAEAQERALACLERFGQRLRSLPPGSVRAVGTNTLRLLREAETFLAHAEEKLGHPIEVIAGREEARLIYLGVAHGLAAGNERRLVVDIGGGSTELIVGDGFTPNRCDSLHMGCVSMSRAYFADGTISMAAMKSAEAAAAVELRPIRAEYRTMGWQRAIGSSGTIRTIRNLIQAAGWGSEDITLPALKRLRKALAEAGRLDRLKLEGLSPERWPVFPGGVAILIAVFNTLRLQSMQVSDQALREGLLYDMLGRIRHEDIREQAVLTLCKRYAVDLTHARRVEATALALFRQAEPHWALSHGEYADLLRWAALLHELGLTVAYSQFHKHGAYLIEHSDLPGFSLQEQAALAALVRVHRRKFPREVFDRLPEGIRLQCLRLCLLLRLAVLLHRSRSATHPPAAALQVTEKALDLRFPPGWLERHPLTRMELEQEAAYVKAAGFGLTFG